VNSTNSNELKSRYTLTKKNHNLFYRDPKMVGISTLEEPIGEEEARKSKIPP